MADPKLKPIKCRQTLGEYAARVTWCEACGFPNGYYDRAHLHHIVKRGRSDERCNLLALCFGCHEKVHVGIELTLGVILSIKKLRDPAGWNPDRLAELRLKPLPDLLPIPPALLAEWEKWQRPTNNEGEVPW